MYNVKQILKMEVAPALGCTEPVAIALAAAAAKSLLGDSEISSVQVWVDKNLYKNALAVSIPGTGGQSGMELAAALGIVGGKPEKKLQVLDGIDENIITRAKALCSTNKVQVALLANQTKIYVRCVVTAGDKVAECEIRNYHDNIVSLKLGGVEQSSPLIKKVREAQSSLEDLEKWLVGLDLVDLIKLLDDLDDEDYAFIREGVETNMRLAEHGLKFGSGLGIGLAFERMARQGLLQRDMALAARILTSAASDARMSGVNLPAMSSAGSGNHGLTAILPIWAIRDYVNVECDKEILRAIALSHIITGYIKAQTGRLTAVCGCSVAAGAGAAAGVTYLLGGSIDNIAGAIINLIQDLAGVICDGAKDGCAIKLSTAAATAVNASLLALQGVTVQPTDGIIGISPEQTMRNLGTLSVEGMIEADRTILGIMLKKHFS